MISWQIVKFRRILCGGKSVEVRPFMIGLQALLFLYYLIGIFFTFVPLVLPGSLCSLINIILCSSSGLHLIFYDEESIRKKS
jgi:hypothetical protein